MKKLILLLFVLAAGINMNAQNSTLNGGTVTVGGQINDPPTPPDGDGEGDPGPPTMYPCGVYCFQNRSNCDVEVRLFHNTIIDCNGEAFDFEYGHSDLITLGPGEHGCFTITINGCRCCIDGPFHFTVAAGNLGFVVDPNSGGYGPTDCGILHVTFEPNNPDYIIQP